jgi:hypothetical protein
MTFFQIGHSDTKKISSRPFVEYSPHQDRASLMSAVKTHTSRRRSRSTSRRKGRTTKVRVVKGKVSLRIGGFPGVQKLGASQLVRFVPLNKLRSAAKRVLGSPPRRGKKRTSRKGGKRRRRRRVGRRH